MRTSHIGIAATLGLAILAGAASPALGQQKPIAFDARGGLGLPAGNLSSLADAGPAFGVDVDFGLSERLFVRVGGGAELYPGYELESEGLSEVEIDLVHLDAGLLYRLTPPEPGSFFASVRATGGVTNLNVPRVQTSVGQTAVEIDISELYPSAGVGATAGYSVSEQLDVYVDAAGYAAFADSTHTENLVRVYNSRFDPDVDALSTIYSIPVTAGLRLRF